MHWPRTLREEDLFWKTSVPQGPLSRPDIPELTRKLQQDLPRVVAAALRLSEEMEGLCMWHEEDKRLTGLKQELGISFINPICLEWEQQGAEGSLFATILILLLLGVFTPSTSWKYTCTNTQIACLLPPPHTHTHTYMLGRMTAQLGCVRGARAGVVWSVCIRVCGRICGEVWAVCVCVYVCACVVWVCGLWRGPGESLLTAGMRKEPLCLLYSGGCAWTREHCPDPSLQHRRAHTHMHQVTHKLRGLLQVSSHTL